MKYYSILKKELINAGCTLSTEYINVTKVYGMPGFTMRASFNYKDLNNPYGIVKILEDKFGNLQLGLMQLTPSKRNDFHRIQEAINKVELSSSNTI